MHTDQSAGNYVLSITNLTVKAMYSHINSNVLDRNLKDFALTNCSIGILKRKKMLCTRISSLVVQMQHYSQIDFSFCFGFNFFIA